VLLYLISVAATLLQLADVPGFAKVVDDVIGAALSDAQVRGDVAQTRFRIASDAKQRPPVVGEKGPVGQFVTPLKSI
jgi:hypothetical protein